MNVDRRASLGLLILLSLTRPALAEPTSADKSLATQLFKEGRALVDQGKVAEGCRKLEESQRLDPGGGTLLNVALCHEKEGRTATAWAEFTEALGIARKDDRPQRIEIAQAHIEALEPTLSRLVVQVPPTADLPDLEIKRDGGTLRRAAWGTAMPVDPGEHLIEASAHGKISWRQTVTVGGKAEVKTIAIPPLENAPVTVTPVAAGTSNTPFSATPIAPAKPPNHAAAWVALGFGAVGLGVGSFFGLQAVSEQSTADDNCSPRCTPEGLRANDQAIRAANLSTVGFGVGFVGVGLATYLFLTNGASRGTTTAAPRLGPAKTVAVDVTPRQLTITGHW
jgi:hypothetical protein